MTNLEGEFHALMHSIYDGALKEEGYPATYFLRMLEELGGIGAAKRLLAKPQVSDGFIWLWEHGRLDLTMEHALLMNDKFWVLFDEKEIDTARRWLKEYKENPPKARS